MYPIYFILVKIQCQKPEILSRRAFSAGNEWLQIVGRSKGVHFRLGLQEWLP